MTVYTLDGFANIFEKLTKRYDTSIVWTDFLDYCIDYFLINDDNDERYWTSKTGKYNLEEVGVFWELFNYWVNLSQEKITENGWYDFFGEFYEAFILAKFKAGDKGQFFTPSSVSDIMTSLTVDNNNGGVFYDPAGGSGRNLLSAHLEELENICVSWDVDEQACKMCVLNFVVHGVQGVVVWCDSLTGEFYDSWTTGKFTDKLFCIRHVKDKEQCSFAPINLTNTNGGDV